MRPEPAGYGSFASAFDGGDLALPDNRYDSVCSGIRAHRCFLQLAFTGAAS
jgi:hypothetical protein